MSSDCYLKDYYDQLPSETAEFGSGDLLGSSGVQTHGGSLLEPEILSPELTIDATAANDATLAGNLTQAGDRVFEPVPASSFQPDLTPAACTETVSETPDATLTCDIVVADTKSGSPGAEIKPLSGNDLITMDSEQKQNAGAVDDEKLFKPEGGGTETVVAESLDGEEVKPELVEVHDVPEQAAAVEDLPPNPPSEEFLEEDTTSLPVEDVICAKPEESTAPVPGAVIDLIYWRDIKKTAAVFSFLLLMLFSLMFCSVISVVAYAALAFLTVTVGFRVYRLVLQTLNGTQQPHPFQEILDLDVSLSPERIQKYATVISCHVNCWISALRDLLLVKNTLSSLKFGVFLWLLTYVGAIFNGLTLIICDVILIFTVPPIYEKYQSQIDAYFGMAKDKVGEIVKKVKAKLPGKKEKTQ